jgi:acetolactate synthase-1/2/3 large subunit
MTFPLSRRDLLKTLAAAGCLAALPEAPAQAGGGGPGWVSGTMNGAQALVEALLAEGTCCVFGIPGAQCNELWDAMKSKGLGYVLVTHEFSAAGMADGYARATGKVGVLAVVPGPGVTNALTGLGEALLDSIPLVCIVCDVAHGPKAHAFQLHELPQVGLLQQICKAVLCVDRAECIPAAVHEAFALARSGEPGPVAVNVPYPLFIAVADYHCPPPCCPAGTLDEAAFQNALHLLADRKRKVGIYAGLGCMDQTPALVQLAEVLQAPVATSISGKGVIPECHPLAVGWGYGPQATRTAEHVFKGVDLVLAIGVRYSEVSTGFYSIPEHHPLIHVDANPHNLGRNVPADVCVPADSGAFLCHLLEYADLIRRPPDGRLASRIAALKHEEAAKDCVIYSKCGVDPMAFVLALRRCTAPDALLYVDVTQCEHYAAEAFTVVQPRTFFNPSNNQAMGWSIPASLGGQRAFPGRQVVTITGDGCFLMTAMEISTAARECLPVKFFVLDDQAYHIMQTLQKPVYLRTTATILARLDYAALAQGFGVGYQEIACNENLEAGIRGALCHHGPVLTRVVTDYANRPLRWFDAVKKRYQHELTTEQKMRILARMGSRAVHFTAREND